LDNPYTIVDLPNGVTEKEFMRRILSYPWNAGFYLPWANDCHTQMQGAFDLAKVPYKGVPNARIDYDDNFWGAVNRNRILREMLDYMHGTFRYEM
jgi:hypothetical protein